MAIYHWKSEPLSSWPGSNISVELFLLLEDGLLVGQGLSCRLLVHVGLVDGDAWGDQQIGGPPKTESGIIDIRDLTSWVLSDEKPSIAQSIENMTEVVD